MAGSTATPREAPGRRPPPGWNPAAHALWLADRRAQALAACAAALNAAAPDETPAQLAQFSYYLFLEGQLPAAAQALQRLLEKQPDDWESLGNLAVIRRRLGEARQAAPLFRALADAQPGNVLAWDGLAATLAGLGDLEGAAQAGTRSLTLKDVQAPRAAPWRPPAKSPQAFAAGKPDLIVFSLWGAAPRYLRGALRNALLAPDIYPGWRCRFHLDETVPGEFVALLQALGSEVVREPAGAPLRQRLAWRFKAAADPGVGRFLVRDADSVIGLREARAVEDWTRSGAWFHVMRDWWSHTDLILAGLWGGIGGTLPDIEAEAQAYRAPAMETPNVDQWFLRDRVWPRIRRHVLVHDRCFRPPGAQPFPGAPPPAMHVGQNEFAARPELQERLLAAWIARYPILARTP